MLVSKLEMRGFRCFEFFEVDFEDNTTLLVGENDIGKSSVFDALEIVLGEKQLVADDVRVGAGNARSEECCVKLTLRLGDDCASAAQKRYVVDSDKVIVTASWQGERTVYKAMCRVAEDQEFRGFRTLSAEDQKQLLKKNGIEPEPRKEDRFEQVDNAISNGVLDSVLDYVEISKNDLTQLVPGCERVSSSEYSDPTGIIQRVLKRTASAAAARCKEQADVVLECIRDALIEDVSKIEGYLKTVHHSVEGVTINPNVDLSRVVHDFGLEVDLGEGVRDFHQLGTGTKRRIWMGLVQWENQHRGGQGGRSVIRLYDEPDSNLHYEAQRILFDSILDLGKQDGVQCIASTHSIGLIDRAPLSCVRLMEVCSEKGRVCRSFGGNDEHVKAYELIGKAVGVSNSALLYEKAFLVVEGESEEASLPIMYRNVYQRTMIEDGVILVNLHSCGAWKSVLEVLLRHKTSVAAMLLDSDCKCAESSANITASRVREITSDEQFLSRNIKFVGEKEFEDSFSSELIARALDNVFPKEDGREWTSTDIDDVRGSEKFSEDLKRLVQRSCVPKWRNEAKKPQIAIAIANEVVSERDVPGAVMAAFELVRQFAGHAMRLGAAQDDDERDISEVSEVDFVS